MDEAEVIRRFYGVEDGKIYPRWFDVGDIVKGSLADCAVMSGDAVRKKKRSTPKPEHVKTSSASQPAQVSQEKMQKKRRGRPRKSS